MDNKGLVFIPDISGFTRFVNETEISHSRLIIQELLEIIINANRIGLEISEIEGDAILFYKFGPPPELKDLYNQVSAMFVDFHRNLTAYENRRYCQCNACRSAINLTLKVISHYGEFTDYSVKNFRKLIGKDIIVAHQLLKNDIPQHEYWLVTEKLVSSGLQHLEGLQWNSSKKEIEAGEITYVYAPLGKLKAEIKEETNAPVTPENMSRVFSLTREFNTDIITLFHATGDFQYRHRWVENVRSVEELTHFLPRVGMKCRYITDNEPVIFYSNDYFYSNTKIQFSETDEAKATYIRFTLDRIDIKRTKLSIDYYVEDKFLPKLKFSLMKKRSIQTLYEKSIKNLDGLVSELKIPSAITS
jgi:hypothetical protein